MNGMGKTVEELRVEFENYCLKEAFEFSGELDKNTYKRLLNNLKKKENSGDKRATTLKKQLISRWERGDRLATNFAKNMLRYGIDPKELG